MAVENITHFRKEIPQHLAVVAISRCPHSSPNFEKSLLPFLTVSDVRAMGSPDPNGVSVLSKLESRSATAFPACEVVSSSRISSLSYTTRTASLPPHRAWSR